MRQFHVSHDVTVCRSARRCRLGDDPPHVARYRRQDAHVPHSADRRRPASADDQLARGRTGDVDRREVELHQGYGRRVREECQRHRGTVRPRPSGSRKATNRVLGKTSAQAQLRLNDLRRDTR